MKGMSLILPTYHPGRVGRANELIKMLRKDSGIDLEIIVVTDNPETYESYKGADLVLKLPYRIGFTRAANTGEKMTKYENLWWIDDYVIPEPGWGPKAMKAFWEKFPDGMGIMDISMQITDCAKSISTRKYVYSLNGMHLLWPEYLHCGDTEMWYRSSIRGQFYTYPEVLWHRDKIFDDCKKESTKAEGWDSIIREERRALNWPNSRHPYTQHDKNANITFFEKMITWADETGDQKNIDLVNNLFNIK